MHFLKNCKSTFDIIFCFGIMYHTIHQSEILDEIKRLRPEVLIIDTNVVLDKNNKSNSTYLFAHKQQDSDCWSVIPSGKMMEVWLSSKKYKFVKNKNLNGDIKDTDYKNLKRITYHCTL